MTSEWLFNSFILPKNFYTPKTNFWLCPWYFSVGGELSQVSQVFACLSVCLPVCLFVFFSLSCFIFMYIMLPFMDIHCIGVYNKLFFSLCVSSQWAQFSHQVVMLGGLRLKAHDVYNLETTGLLWPDDESSPEMTHTHSTATGCL